MTRLAQPTAVVVEDHPLVAVGLRASLKPRVRVVATVHDATKALDVIAEHRPDLVLLDLTMPQRNGLDLLPDIHAQFPTIRVLVVSMHLDRALVRLAMERGAHGFIPKEAPADELREAVQEVLRGREYVSPRLLPARMTDPPLDGPAPIDRLSRRQRQVLTLIAQGLTSGAISRQLGLSIRTIEWHRGALRKALGATSEWALVSMALAAGLGPPPPGLRPPQ